MTCRTGCPTQDHPSWGACFRAGAVQFDRHGLAGHRSAEKQKDARLSRYEDARRAGLQPANTTWHKIRRAEEIGV